MYTCGMSWLTVWSRNVESSFELWGFSFHYYGIIIACGIYLLIWRSTKRAHYYGVNGTVVDSLAMWVFLPALLGARLYHVFSEWGYYQLHPEQILSVWRGGIGIYGALLGGALGLYYACRYYGVKFMSTLDLMAPYALLAQAIGRWGNFFNQEGFGPPTDSYFKIFIDPELRPVVYANVAYFHPTWFYESVLNLIGFGLLLWIERRSNYKAALWGWYMITYGVNRFVVEFFRMDTAAVDGVKVAHVISLGLIIAGGWLVWKRRYRTA